VPPADFEDETLPVGPTGHVGVRIVRPEGSPAGLPVVMYFHGGGWILGDEKTHDRLVRELAVRARVAVVFVKYTPSPEAQFPVPLEQAYAATSWSGSLIDPASLRFARPASRVMDPPARSDDTRRCDAIPLRTPLARAASSAPPRRHAGALLSVFVLAPALPACAAGSTGTSLSSGSNSTGAGGATSTTGEGGAGGTLLTATSSATGTGGEGGGSICPPDADGDGIPDEVEGKSEVLDTDGDATPDYLDTDSDGDSMPDALEGQTKFVGCNSPQDSDGDGKPDFQDKDSDNNGLPDRNEIYPDGSAYDASKAAPNPADTDGDGIPDYADPDNDGDALPDAVEIVNGVGQRVTVAVLRIARHRAADAGAEDVAAAAPGPGGGGTADARPARRRDRGRGARRQREERAREQREDQATGVAHGWQEEEEEEGVPCAIGHTASYEPRDKSFNGVEPADARSLARALSAARCATPRRLSPCARSTPGSSTGSTPRPCC